MMEKQSHKRLKDDVERGEQQKPGFDEGGEIFILAVAVGVLLIRGLVREAHGEVSDDGRDQVEP